MMKALRVLLAALALLEAPGLPAYAQLARSVPVRSAPVTAVPAALSLPALPGTGWAAPVIPAAPAPAVGLPSAPAAAATPELGRAARAAVAPAAAPRALAGPAAAGAAVREAEPLPRPDEALSAAAPALEGPPTARGALASGAAAVRRAWAAPRAALDALFTGARRAGSDAAAPAGAALGPFPGRVALAAAAPAPAATAAVPAPAGAAAPASAGAPDVKALSGLFIARTASIASFIVTSIAFPFLATPVVGWSGYGALMAFGPLAALATGPLNGLIAQRLSARKAMALNAAVRAGLALILPAAAACGALNFWTLLGASVANGWIMNSVMTTEGAYLKTLAGEKHLGTFNGLAWMNYLAVQVLLGLIVGVGSVVDHWAPASAFYLSAAVHAFFVLPVLWLTMPDLAPPAARPGPPPSQVGLAARAAAFAQAHGLPLALTAAATAAYAAFSTTLPLVGAILYWVTRTRAFRDVWSGAARADSPEETLLRAERDAEGDPARRARLDAELALRERRLRHGMLYLGLAALFLFPLQYFVLPAAAAALAGGAAGKGLVLGRLLGALFMGNLVSVAARARLPDPTVPGLGTLDAKGLIEGAVTALAVGWSLAALAPGSLPVAAAVGAAALVLMRLAARVSESGWIRLMGVGFLATALPYFVWAGSGAGAGVAVLLPLSLLVAGMFYGPAFVALNTYFQRWTAKDRMGPAIGAQGSFFNGAVSLGYGLVTAAAGLLAEPLPGLLGVLCAFFALGGVVFWAAPRFLPGLPRGLLRPKGETPGR